MIRYIRARSKDLIAGPVHHDRANQQTGNAGGSSGVMTLQTSIVLAIKMPGCAVFLFDGVENGALLRINGDDLSVLAAVHKADVRVVIEVDRVGRLKTGFR